MIKLKNCFIGVKQQSLTHSYYILIFFYTNITVLTETLLGWFSLFYSICVFLSFGKSKWPLDLFCHGRDRMVVGFTTVQSVPITIKVVTSNPVHGEVYSIQHYVIKVVSDLRQVVGFLRALRFPRPIKLTVTI
jgi:hypothetical protein